MSYYRSSRGYRTCQFCGANNDPQESCDCPRRQPQQKYATPVVPFEKQVKMTGHKPYAGWAGR